MQSPQRGILRDCQVNKAERGFKKIMKFNFRKIASILSSVVMVSSTVAFATAANFSAPFVSGGAADVALVYGSKTATGGVAGGVSATGGDFVKIEGATKLSVGKNLTEVKPVNLGKADLPSTLSDVNYQSKDGQTSTVTQEIKLGNDLKYSYFTDSRSPINNNPTLGINVNKANVMNYTATFTPYVESDVTTAGRLEDIENTDITLLGKNYKLLNAYNASSSTKLELMGGTVSDTLGLNEQKDYTIGDKKYAVKVIYVGQVGNTNEAKLEVNGQTTNKMNIGTTQKLSDGTQFGIRDILYQNFAGGVMKVEFSLGAEKLTIENAATIKLNDVEETNVKGYISRSESSGKVRIDKITLQWKPTDYVFLYGENSTLTMPGLNSVSFKDAGLTTPVKESIKIANSGSKTIALTIPILAGNDTATTFFTKIGNEGSNRNLITGTGTSINFDTDTDEAFVATYQSGTAGESYYLDISSITQSSGINYTTIRDKVTSQTAGTCSKIQSGGAQCTIGSITLTLSSVSYDNNNLTIAGTAGTFDRVISKEGALIYLPVIDATATSGTGPGINLTGSNATNTAAWKYSLIEEDKDSNIGAGTDSTKGKTLVGTVGWTSDKTEVKSVNAANFSGAQYLQVQGTSTTYLGYAESDLGTKVTYDTVPTQDSVEFEYHGGQSYGNLFVTTPSVTVSSTGATGGAVKELGSVSVADTEAASVSAKNLIVVGGSCVNSVAADLLGGALCGADFQTKTGVGAGSFLIQTFARTGDKVATLVAGYNAADTTNAAKYLTTQTVDTMVGKKYTGTSATSASLVTTTA